MNKKETPISTLRKERKYLFRNHVYLVFFPRQKDNIFNQEMLSRLSDIFNETCNQKKCDLLEFHGGNDYVRLLVSLYPTVSLSSLIGKLKGKSSYFLLKEFPEQLQDKIVNKHFWSSSYCAISDSSGINALEKIENFLQSTES